MMIGRVSISVSVPVTMSLLSLLTLPGLMVELEGGRVGGFEGKSQD